MTSFQQLVLALLILFFFFFNDTATTEIYTLSLHDALPISVSLGILRGTLLRGSGTIWSQHARSEEHTSELQSRGHLVCRLLLEKKNSDESLFGYRLALPRRGERARQGGPETARLRRRSGRFPFFF